MKLEEGCLAIVINSECGNNGKIVKVIKCLGKIYGNNENIYWEFEGSLPGMKIRTKIPIENTNKCPEYQLMRIDGFTEETENFEQELLEN